MYIAMVLTKNPHVYGGWAYYQYLGTYGSVEDAGAAAGASAQHYKGPGHRVVIAEVQFEAVVPTPPVELLKFKM